jgi:hypothetical protein
VSDVRLQAKGILCDLSDAGMQRESDTGICSGDESEVEQMTTTTRATTTSAATCLYHDEPICDECGYCVKDVEHLKHAQSERVPG